MANNNLSALFSSISEIRKTVKAGGYEVSELSLKHQKDLIGSIFDQHEAPAKLMDSLNKIILDCAIPTADVSHETTVLERPYLLRTIRDVSLDKTKSVLKVQEQDGTEAQHEFKFNKIDFADLKKIKDTKVIKVNKTMSIHLYVPTLYYDSSVNAKLVNIIGQKKRIVERAKEKMDGGTIANLYLTFELIKFIEKITVNEVEYFFNQLSIDDCIRVINELPQSYINEISDFIKPIKELEATAFTGTDTVTGKEHTIQLSPTIFSAEL